LEFCLIKICNSYNELTLTVAVHSQYLIIITKPQYLEN